MIKTYELGDMTALYDIDESRKNAELILLPAKTGYKSEVLDKNYAGSLLQVKLAGDIYTGCYSPGVSMYQSVESLPFYYSAQSVKEEGDTFFIITEFKDDRGLKASHFLKYRRGERSLRSCVTLENESDKKASVEYLPSFCLSGISPLMEEDGHDSLILHRIRSVWSMEGRKESIPLEDLQLEPSWTGHAVRCERFGAAGSYAVNRFYPIMVLQDSKNDIFWGAQLMHNASWQMEVIRRGRDVKLAGGLADREFGHWMKDISPGSSFTTPEAILSVYRGSDEEEIYRRLTSALDRDVNEGPSSEQSLPVLFNEYCTTWGNPSQENIRSAVDAIRGRGMEYFVIDAGWYKQPDVSWDLSMGDYEPSKALFKDGLEETVKYINDAGMKAGLWFEIDNVGSASKAYTDEKHLLKRDGHVLTTTSRRFWDLRQKEVKDILKERVIGTLKRYGFEYLKIDCNDTVGIGCDGAESLGEGLRQNQEASAGFVKTIKEEIPGIIIENCASGGHKSEPLMMSLCSMASFSDAHECEEIPVIAANLHRVILPRQSQIWAVLRKTDSPKRTAYSVINTFLGRMCLSGDVAWLTDEQWELVERGIAFYKKAAPIIKEGRTYYFGTRQTAYRHLSGFMGIFREDCKKQKAYALFYGFNEMKGKKAEIRIPAGYRISEIYSYKEEMIGLHNDKDDSLHNVLEYTFDEDMKAVAVLMEN